MADINDSHKEERAKYFTPGLHEVQISGATLGEVDDKEYLEFNLIDEDEREDTARLWFNTDKAIGYSFSIIKGIFSHNTPEEKRDEMKKKLDAQIKNTKDLEKACQGLVGKKCYFVVAESKTRTYEDKEGKTRASFDKNIYGYKPEVAPAPQTVTEAPAGEAKADAGQEPFGF